MFERLRQGLALAVAVGIGAGGCEREPLDFVCPDVAVGELVVTEIRGEQSGSDTYGQWIELYNAADRELELHGLHVEVTRLDGSATALLVVRRSLVVAAGGYVVLGRFASDDLPEHVDYGYITDYDGSLFDSAAVQVFACDEEIDRIIYRDLPPQGTYSLDGDLDPPDATTNDEDTAWCVDDVEEPDPTELGIPGTPGKGNRPCST